MDSTPWWVSLLSVVVGGIIGGGVSIGGIMLSQGATDARARVERERQEERIRALFAAHVSSVLSILIWQVEDGTVRDLEYFRYRLAPLEAAYADKTLTLALTPSQIQGLADAFVIIDLNRDSPYGRAIRRPVTSLRLNPHGMGLPPTALVASGPTLRQRVTEMPENLLIWAQFSRGGSSIESPKRVSRRCGSRPQA